MTTTDPHDDTRCPAGRRLLPDRRPSAARRGRMCGSIRRRGCARAAGCVPVVAVVGIGAGATMATDPRSMGAQVDDETIELKLQSNPTVMRDDLHLNVASYNGVVLLVGQVPTRPSATRSARSPRPPTACAA